MNSIEEAREFFSKDIYAVETTGIVIEDCAENYAKCSLKVNESHTNATGHIMGGAIFTLADFTFAVASNFGGTPTVTTMSNISYLSSPKGDILYSEAKLVKNGKRICFFNIEITDNLGNMIATVSATGTHLG